MKPSSDTSPSPPNINKDFDDDKSDRDHAQEGQEPVETVQEVSGETQKDNKEKKVDRSPKPHCALSTRKLAMPWPSTLPSTTKRTRGTLTASNIL